MKLYLLIVGIIALALLAIFASSNSNDDIYTWTKAVCDDVNYCVDVILECKSGEITGVGFTGATAHFGPEWEDPRPLESREAWC
jgi:hypothetical protein